jgi:hypothetical protein
MNRQHDIEPYWQNEDDWLCTVEFLLSNDPEGRVFVADCDFSPICFSIGAALGQLTSSSVSRSQTPFFPRKMNFKKKNEGETRTCELSMMFSSDRFFPALNSASSVALSEPSVSSQASGRR